MSASRVRQRGAIAVLAVALLATFAEWSAMTVLGLAYATAVLVYRLHSRVSGALALLLLAGATAAEVGGEAVAAEHLAVGAFYALCLAVAGAVLEHRRTIV